MLSSRITSKSDASAIAELANLHQLTVDPHARPMNMQSATNLVVGRIDPFPATLYFDQNQLLAVIGLNPDANKWLLLPEIYAHPKFQDQPFFVEEALRLSGIEFPSYEIQPTANSLDRVMLAAYFQLGFAEIRTYSIMRSSLGDARLPELPGGFSFLQVDMESQEHLGQWHKTHQDAFQNHFGFKAMAFDSWSMQMLKDQNLDRQGAFILLENDEPVGFVECTDECADQLSGYVAHIGVAQSHQGRGLGRALLEKAMHHSKTKGFSALELTVDLGNESAALRLYERLGLTAQSSWLQLSLASSQTAI